MTPDALNFTGDAVTYLGLIGVISTAIIVVTSFRRYFNSPLRKWYYASLGTGTRGTLIPLSTHYT